MKKIFKGLLVVLLMVVLALGGLKIYDIYGSYFKVRDITQQVQTKEENQKHETLEKAEEMVIDVKKSLEDFNLRLVVTTGHAQFNFTPIDKSGFAGNNSMQYQYHYDFDIGLQMDNIEVLYDEKKVPVIVIPKEKFREFRIREDISNRKLVEREVSGMNSVFEGILGFGEIEAESLSANNKAAQQYAERLILKERDAWYNGETQDNIFEQAYQNLLKELQIFLETKGIARDKYKINK